MKRGFPLTFTFLQPKKFSEDFPDRSSGLRLILLAPPSHPSQADSGILGLSSTLTATGSHRSHTGFPASGKYFFRTISMNKILIEVART